MAQEQLSQVASPTLARDISIVCWRYEAHRLGGAREHVAQCIRKALKLVCFEANFIMNDVVVGRLRCALQTTMSYEKEKFVSEANAVLQVIRLTLEVEVEFIYCRDATINYGSRLWVAVIRSVLPFGGIEPGVVPLAANDNSQLRTIRFLGLIKGMEGLENLWTLFEQDSVELTLNEALAARP